MIIFLCFQFMFQIQGWLGISVDYNYLACSIIGFSPGSVVASFAVDIYGENSEEAQDRAGTVYSTGLTSGETEWIDEDGMAFDIGPLSFEGKNYQMFKREKRTFDHEYFTRITIWY